MSDQAVVAKGPAKRVKLWNDGSTLFDYEILGTQYTIKPGEYLTLARRTAITVRGFYPGKNKPVSLRIEPIEGDYDGMETVQKSMDKEPEKVTVYSCFKCDAEFPKKEELVAHMKEKHSPGRKAVKQTAEE